MPLETLNPVPSHQWQTLASHSSHKLNKVLGKPQVVTDGLG